MFFLSLPVSTPIFGGSRSSLPMFHAIDMVKSVFYPYRLILKSLMFHGFYLSLALFVIFFHGGIIYFCWLNRFNPSFGPRTSLQNHRRHCRSSESKMDRKSLENFTGSGWFSCRITDRPNRPRHFLFSVCSAKGVQIDSV